MQSRNQDLNSLILEVNVKFPSYLSKNSLVKNYVLQKSNIENNIENLFKNIILADRYARNKIIINIEVIEINCDLLPFATLGISLALNEANIEQKGICTSANIIKKNNELIIDPTLEEELSAEFKLNWGCLCDLEENSLFIQKGIADEETLKKVKYS
jgi:ribonuclease PH